MPPLEPPRSSPPSSSLSRPDFEALLAGGADSEDLRRAWVQAVVRLSPDREPERFQDLRRAFERVLLKAGAKGFGKRESPESAEAGEPASPSAPRLIDRLAAGEDLPGEPDESPEQRRQHLFAAAFAELLELQIRDEKRFRLLLDQLLALPEAEQQAVRQRLAATLLLASGWYYQPRFFHQPPGWSRAVAALFRELAGWEDRLAAGTDEWQAFSAEQRDWLAPLFPGPSEAQPARPTGKTAEYSDAVAMTQKKSWQIWQVGRALLLYAGVGVVILLAGFGALWFLTPDFVQPKPDSPAMRAGTASGTSGEDSAPQSGVAAAREALLARHERLCGPSDRIFRFCASAESVWLDATSAAAKGWRNMLVLVGRDDCTDCRRVSGWLDGFVRPDPEMLARAAPGEVMMTGDGWAEHTGLQTMLFSRFHIVRLVMPEAEADREGPLYLLRIMRAKPEYKGEMPWMFIAGPDGKFRQAVTLDDILSSSPLLPGQDPAEPASGLGLQPLMNRLMAVPPPPLPDKEPDESPEEAPKAGQPAAKGAE